MKKNVNILVVDDDPILLDLLIETLEAIGHSPKGAKDGEDALAFLETNKVDLLITDIKMPGINGLELAKKVNKLIPELPHSN